MQSLASVETGQNWNETGKMQKKNPIISSHSLR